MPSNHLILCCPLLLLPLIFSNIRVFSNELTLHIRWQVFEFQPHHQCLQCISRVGFLKDWLASSPCTPKDSQESDTTSQFKTINSSALSVLYGPALILYMTIGKIIALIIQTLVGKVMSLLFNMLSRFFIAFLPRSKCLLISWLQSQSEENLGSKKIKYVTVSTFLFYLPWRNQIGCHDLMKNI